MITINTNMAASQAAYNLDNTNVNLQRSLNRLSSGSRINSSYDDAGGLAVSMKLSASIRRTEATQANVGNAIAYLQTQDGVLKSADKILVRMSELAQLATDVTKSTNDLALYDTEFDELNEQLDLMLTEELNGILLFTAGSTLTVVTSHDGDQTVGITQANLAANVDALISTSSITSTTAALDTVDYLQTAIQNLADLRATNGSEQVRLTFAADMLAINKINLESANSRILDVDVATESSNLAKLNILQQAGTAMLAQANVATQSILRLIS